MMLAENMEIALHMSFVQTWFSIHARQLPWGSSYAHPIQDRRKGNMQTLDQTSSNWFLWQTSVGFHARTQFQRSRDSIDDVMDSVDLQRFQDWRIPG